jgi:hypothetical protein
MVGQLPEAVRERHRKIHDEAIASAKAAGWSGEHETVDDK